MPLGSFAEPELKTDDVPGPVRDFILRAFPNHPGNEQRELMLMLAALTTKSLPA